MALNYDCNKSSLCEVFIVKPQRVNMLIGSTVHHFVTIRNKTKKPEVVVILPPITEYFEIQTVNDYVILPEKWLDLTVKLKGAFETRPYYDRIKIACSKGCCVDVRLIANPDLHKTIKIPNLINLGSVPLGETASYRLKIPAMKTKTPFMFVYSIYNENVSISPLRGSVCKVAKQVLVSYTAKAYITLNYPIHLYIPSLSELPFFIIITADTKPGILSEMIYKKDDKQKNYFAMKLPMVIQKQGAPIPSKPKLEPLNRHQVNLYLIRKDKKPMDAYELLGPFGRPMSEEEEAKTAKQAEFIKEVLKYKRACTEPLHHKRNVLNYLGTCQDDGWDILYEKYMADLEKQKRPEEYEPRPQIIKQRILTSITTGENLKFTKALPNMWFVRRQILSRFIEAARRIILKTRLEKHLAILKVVFKEMKATDERYKKQTTDL